MRVQQVVGVKDEKAVVMLLRIVLLDLLQKEPQGIAFAHLHLVLPLKDPGPMSRGNSGRVVSAVVRYHVHVHQVRRILLAMDTLHQLGNDRTLVPSGNQHRVPAQFLGGEGPAFFQQPHHSENGLVAVAGHKQGCHQEIDRR